MNGGCTVEFLGTLPWVVITDCDHGTCQLPTDMGYIGETRDMPCKVE